MHAQERRAARHARVPAPPRHAKTRPAGTPYRRPAPGELAHLVRAEYLASLLRVIP